MESLKNKAENFWIVFSERESEIRTLIDENKLAEKISDIGSTLGIDMPFMMGTAIEGKYELIFNPAGLKSRYFISDYIKKKMPEELKEKWTFYCIKPPMPLENMHLLINDEDFYEKDFSVLIDSVDNEGKRVNITVSCPKLFSNQKKFFSKKKVFDEDAMYNIVYNFLIELLGEGIVEFYLKRINIKKSLRGGMTLEEFSSRMDEIIEEKSWEKNPRIVGYYVTYKYDVDNVEDLNSVRNDIIVGFSSNIAVEREYAGDCYEYEYMKEQGSIYGMVFYDNREISNEEKIPFRDKLENILYQAPEYGDVFEVIGAATGIYRSYIDVIIYDFERFKTVLEMLK